MVDITGIFLLVCIGLFTLFPFLMLFIYLKRKRLNHEAIAHEIWAAAQLTDFEGVEDGVDRIVDILKENYEN